MTWLAVVATVFGVMSGETEFIRSDVATWGPNVLEQGIAISCNDGTDGDYREIILKFRSSDRKPLAELHAGPRDEFGLFAGHAPEGEL